MGDGQVGPAKQSCKLYPDHRCPANGVQVRLDSSQKSAVELWTLGQGLSVQRKLRLSRFICLQGTPVSNLCKASLCVKDGPGTSAGECVPRAASEAHCPLGYICCWRPCSYGAGRDKGHRARRTSEAASYLWQTAPPSVRY